MTLGFCREVDENCAVWATTQRVVVISYRNFGTTNRHHPQGSRIQKEASWPLKVGLVGSPETSARYYHYLLRNNAEEGRSQIILWLVCVTSFQKYRPTKCLCPRRFCNILCVSVATCICMFMTGSHGYRSLILIETEAFKCNAERCCLKGV